jgi:hypothetical protein
MAATKRTRNKLTHARTVIYWLAQIQGTCSQCNEPLVGGSVSDADDLTVEHVSGTYDHKAKRERGTCKGGRLMHSNCHRSMTAIQNSIWKHRHSKKLSKAQRAHTDQHDNGL